MAFDAKSAGAISPKPRIFISYSRKDLNFADRIALALSSRGFEPLIDRTEILAFEDWWQRIEVLISRADTVVFVLSPDSVASDIALKEVEHAARLNKRFAPVVCRRVEDAAIPPALRRLNFVFFDDAAIFDHNVNQLAEALQTDIAWVRQHTEFGEAARRWSKSDNSLGLLLRSPALEEAERWIASRPHSAPQPTAETQTFIAESRRGATRRRNILTASLASGLCLALALAGLAYWQRGIAVEQRQIADDQKRLAQTQRNLADRRRAAALAEVATGERLRGNWDSALRLGVHAVRLDQHVEERAANSAIPSTALAESVAQNLYRLNLSGHDDTVNDAQFSADGQLVVTASKDKTTRIWDASTGNQLKILRGHNGDVNAAAFSPDGKLIVTASSDGTARLWSVADAKEIATLRGHEGAVISARFSPDGTRVVTSSADKTARIWDVGSAREVMNLRGHEHTVRTAAFSADNSRIVTASLDKTARIWDATSGTELLVLRPEEPPAKTGEVLDALALSSNLTSAAFNSAGTMIATTGYDHVVRLWDAATGKQLQALEGFAKAAESVAFSPDGSRLAAASRDSSVRLWGHGPAQVLTGHGASVTSVAFSPDGLRIVTASEDKTARIWNAASSSELKVIRGHTSYVYAAAFSPDGKRFVTASDDKTARVWDTKSGELLSKFEGHEKAVWQASFGRDGSTIATASSDGTVRIWDATTAKQTAQIESLSTAFNRPKTLVATVDAEKRVHVWDFAKTTEVGLTKVKADAALLSVSPDGSQLIMSSADNTPQVWSLTSGQRLAVLMGHQDRVLSADFSPDGTRIVTASADGTARVWDASSGAELLVLKGHDVLVVSASFNSDGTRIATAGADNSARIWDAATGKQLTVLLGHTSFLRTAVFSEDGSRLLTAADDGTARIWDVRFATASTTALLSEVCSHRLRGIATLSRDEMRAAGYSDDTATIDVCAGAE